MSYCLNPSCSQPKNPDQVEVCKACGAKLLLRDRYRVTKPLGKGGFGATFLATDLYLPGEPSCVIKQLRLSNAAQGVLEMARELFAREAQTLGKIGNHPQLPRLLDYFEHSQQFYLIQEYVSGNNLQQEVRQNGPFSEAGIRQFLSEMLPMLEYLHSHQLIHRDIKPANIIRREEDRKLVLIDFGAVKNQVNPTLAESSSQQTALTSFAVGTPGYAPPEQMAMRPVYASDIYSIGATCIYLLTGKSPKDWGYDPSSGLLNWQREVNISDHLAGVLKKMSEMAVSQRYQSAREVLNALEMEAYLDSLSQGLINQSHSEQKQPSASKNLTQPSPASSATGTAKLAEVIRERRARKEQQVGDTVSGKRDRSLVSSQAAKTIPQTRSSRKPKAASKKLDADALLTAYQKGRRDFAQQDLRGLNLGQAHLSEGIFQQAQLMRTNFRKAELSSANFRKAHLNQSVLRDANLTRAYLGDADLEGADLRGATLKFADFSQANLKKANLCGANLTNAKISEEQLAQARTNWATILPSGKRGIW